MQDREEGLIGSRIAKLDRLRERGIDPYPPRYSRTSNNHAAVAEFEAWEAAVGPEPGDDSAPAPEHSLAGRIVSMRVMGRAAFLDLRDGSGRVQAMFRQNVLGDDFDLLKDLDLGDFIGVSGSMLRTRTGEVTIEARKVVVLAKGMRPLPEKIPRIAGRGNTISATLPRPYRRSRSYDGVHPAQPGD